MLIKELSTLKQKVQQDTTVQERYETSADFDRDMFELEQHLAEAMHVTEDPDWMRHLRETDKQFGTSSVEYNRRAVEKLTLAQEAFKALYKHLENAS